MSTVTSPAAAATWALLSPPRIGSTRRIHAGGRWFPTTSSMMILSGHGAARLGSHLHQHRGQEDRQRPVVRTQQVTE